MANLSCEATNCLYNMDKKCSKGLISVGGKSAHVVAETSCESFVDAKGSAKNNAGFEGKTTSINCDAKNCTFNSCGKCSASYVSIEGSQAKESCDTACGTFSTL